MKIPTLSDYIASSAVCNVLNGLQGQLEDQLNRSLLNNRADPELLQRPFISRHGWITVRPYSTMRFKLQYSDFSFLQLCNAIEIFHGIQIQYLFMEELTKQVKETVGQILDQHLLSLGAKACERSSKSCEAEN